MAIKGRAARALIFVVCVLLLSSAVLVEARKQKNVDSSRQQLATKNWRPVIKKSWSEYEGSASTASDDSEPFDSYGSEASSSSSGSACAYPGYSLSGVVSTDNGFQANLNLLKPGPYAGNSKELTLEIILQSEDIIRFRIYDPTVANPWELIPGIIKSPPPTSKPTAVNYNVEFTQEPFGFSIIRVSNGETIFNTSIPMNCGFNGLIYSQHYLEISTSFASQNPNLYGLGERTSQLRLKNNITYTIFNKDEGTASTPDINLYGSHPFYMQLEDNGLAHGVFLYNSNAMDVVIQPDSLTYKVVGGSLDFYFFMGSSPLEVIQQYTSVIGTTHMPPYWALGWHQCRWGYSTVQATMAVVANYSANNIPLETMWNDIDYMDEYQDFTLDPENFPEDIVAQFIDSLHANGQHYIMIIDPGIHINETYQPFNDLIDSGAYIREADGVTPVTGKVWPGSTYFPDFLHPNGTDFWLKQLQAWYEKVQFDGVWIDMNEISNFCDGTCGQPSNTHMPSGQFDPNYPPYVPGGIALSDKTLNMTSLQFNGTQVYYSHNLYGYTEGIATRVAIEQILGTRSTIISRSTFVGAGYHFGHWLGDNDSQYADLYYSIPGILAMNMFGIPFVGADICGFNGNTTAELCGRWIQLGCWYPFSRNHNTHNAIPQEPYVFGEEVINIAIDSINLKYTLAPFYYTLLYQSHVSGDPVVRPLLFEYPTDLETFGLDTQFLVGDSIMVSPVITEGATSIMVYFPEDTWYNFFTGAVQPSGTYNLSCPIGDIKVHLRGGSILPTQPTDQYVRPKDGIPITLEVARTLPFEMLIALDSEGNAEGQLFMDDGLTIDSYEDGKYSLVTFDVTTTENASKFTSQIVAIGYTQENLIVGNITVFGVSGRPQNVLINGQSTTDYTYSTIVNALTINDLSLNIFEAFEVDWS